MKSFTRFLKLVLVFALACPATQAQQQPQVPRAPDSVQENLDKVEKFIAELQKTKFVGLILEDDLTKLLADGNIQGLLDLQGEQFKLSLDGPQDSSANYEWQKEKAEYDRQAREIAKSIFSQKISNINLTLLALLKKFLMEDQTRSELNYVMRAIVNYKFNDDEKMRLRMEAQTLHQFTVGSVDTLWVAMGLGAVVMVGGVRYVPKLWKELSEKLVGMIWRREEKAAVNAIKPRGPTGDEILEEAERQGLRPRRVVAEPAVKMTVGEATSSVIKYKALGKFANVLSSGGQKWFNIVVGSWRWAAVVTGGAAAGGAVNVAGQKIWGEIFPESSSNTVTEFDDLQDNYYDGLAALRLSCQTHDFAERILAQKEMPELRATVLEMNRYFSEAELLKRIRFAYTDNVDLPSEIHSDPNTGAVYFEHVVRGQKMEEHFDCAKLKGVPGEHLRVSINAAYEDIVSVRDHLKSLQEQQQKDKKKNSQ